ncbi:hypothetical protein FM106_11085 [Brachybacterium faecium]|nr:hypothetical protein FM106_11085 [Brachybacterium faecium]
MSLPAGGGCLGDGEDRAALTVDPSVAPVVEGLDRARRVREDGAAPVRPGSCPPPVRAARGTCGNR